MEFDLILPGFESYVVLDGMLRVLDQFVQSIQVFFGNAESGLFCNIGLQKEADFRKVFNVTELFKVLN